MPHDLGMTGTSEKSFWNQIKEDQILCAGFVAGLIFSLMPLFTADVFPFVDYPIHLNLIQIASKINSDIAVGQMYQTDWFTPYSTFFLLGKWLHLIFPLEFTGRILLMLYFLATPLAFSLLLYVLNRPLRNTLWIFPLLYNFSLSWGFIPFLLAVPLLLAWIASICALFAQKGHPWLVSVLGVLVFFTHLFAFVIGAIVAIIILLTGKAAWRDKIIWAGSGLLFPGLLSIFWYTRLSYSSADQVFLSKAIQFPSLGYKLKFLPDFCLSGDPVGVYHWIFLIYAGLMGLVWIASMGKRNRKDSRADRPNLRLMYIIPGILAGMYVICPYSLLTAVWLFNRLAFLSVAGCCILLSDKATVVRRIADIFVILLVIVISIYTTRLYLHFSNEAAEGLACINQIPPRQRLRYLPLNSRSQFTDQTVYDHFDQYYALQKGGTVHNPFAVLTHMPIQYKEPFFSQETSFKPGIREIGGRFQTDLRFHDFDYFLLRLPPNLTHDPLPDLFGFDTIHVDLIQQNSSWVLLGKLPRGAD